MDDFLLGTWLLPEVTDPHIDCIERAGITYNVGGDVTLTFPCGLSCTMGNVGPKMYREYVESAHEHALRAAVPLHLRCKHPTLTPPECVDTPYPTRQCVTCGAVVPA